ncbi:MAG TPA: Gfo/Idh/MocA family oxidoreductase [Phycisphaerae bacterium]|nr:Gfo/Idh/MocA family oxidoreductase [Phycisphaerae bacterium]
MIRVGLIGAGFIGRNHFNQYEKMARRARVHALCDKQAERLAGDWSGVGGNIGDRQGTRRDLTGIKPCADWHDLVADPDVDLVDICLPTTLHKDITVAALAAGKHVLCEKPMALAVSDCDQMLAAADKARGLFMVAQCIRFWPEYVLLKQACDDGRFGRLLALNLRRQSEKPSHSLNNWLNQPQLSGGALFDLHIHDIDFAMFLLGKPGAITAQGWGPSSDGFDRVYAMWHYPSGTNVQIEGYWDMPNGFGFNMGFTARFEKAAIVWDLSTGKTLSVFTDGAEPTTPQLPSAEDGYYGEIDYFLTCIEKNRKPAICPPRASRDAVAIADLTGQSIRSGRPVEVRLG